jgi:hypothetical protein
MEPLSQILQQHIIDLESSDDDALSSEESREVREARRLASELAKVIVRSREILALDSLSPVTDWIQNHPDSADYILDTHYAMRQLKDVPTLVRRTLQLAELNSRDTPSRQTNIYLAEASRAYIQGLNHASVAMSRAALEQALKEQIGVQGDGGFYELKEIFKRVEGRQLLSKTSFLAAKDLAKKGNKVLHDSPIPSEAKAFEVLIGVRSVIEELYGGNGRD